MEKTLYNRDTAVLRFNLAEPYIRVLNNDLLPYALKDFVKSTGEKDFKGSVRDITTIKDYLASRTLNLSRENAKVILNVAALPQSLHTDEKIKIVLACNGLSMQDNFWIKDNGDAREFKDVCLRTHHLSEASYDIAILGRHVTATTDDLIPDLTTEGMFPKYWRRAKDGSVELWKTDKTTNNINSQCEVRASNMLDLLGIPHVSYRKEERDGSIFSVCKCMASDNLSFVPIQEIIDWHNHLGKNFPEMIRPLFDKYFPNMCVADYLLANTDRHNENWGVMVDNKNEIVSFAPIFDMNQTLVADYMGTDISELIYEPTGLTFSDSIAKWAQYSDIDFEQVKFMSERIESRKEDITSVIRSATNNQIPRTTEVPSEEKEDLPPIDLAPVSSAVKTFSDILSIGEDESGWERTRDYEEPDV